MPQALLKTSPKNRNPQPQKITRNPDLKTAQLGGKTAALATLLQYVCGLFGQSTGAIVSHRRTLPVTDHSVPLCKH